MLRPALAHPCATAQQPAEKAEGWKRWKWLENDCAKPSFADMKA